MAIQNMLHQRQHTTLSLMNKKNKTPYLASAVIILIVAILGAFIAEIYAQNKKIARLEQYREFYSSALMTNVHNYLQSLQEKYDAVLCDSEIVLTEQAEHTFSITNTYTFKTDEAMSNMLHASEQIKRDLMRFGIVLNNHRDDWSFAMGENQEIEQPLPTCTIRVAYNGIQEGNLLLAYPDIYFKTLGVLEALNDVITRMNSAASVKQHAEAYRAILAICIKNYEELKNEDRHFEQSPLKEFPHFLRTFREEHESLLKSIATGLDGLRQVNYHSAGIGNEVRDAAEQLEHIIANWPHPMHPADEP